MYKNNKKKSIFACALLLMVAVSSVFVAGTYAKYISTATANGQVTVAKWAIKVNSTDITPAGQTTLGNVTLTTATNANVVSGKIAPQGTATGEFEIDPTGTEVAIGYKFSLGTIESSTGTCSDTSYTTKDTCTANSGTWTSNAVPTGFAVSKVEYKAGAGSWTTITPASGVYSGEIALASSTAALSANEKVTVRVTVEWTDNDETTKPTEENTDDPNHTAAGVKAPTLTIPVEVTVYQKV